jgi:hypothetical protein
VDVIFLIPARAGSKRLPGKNKRLFCGLPLWMWSWAQAKRLARSSDAVVVSSDDQDIYSVTGDAPRPPEWALDTSPSEQLIGHYGQFDDVCLLQPTSPTRTDSLILGLLHSGESCRSVTNGVPNGQCYVFRMGKRYVHDIETPEGHDIDVLEDFEAAEQDMLRRFQ